eukprot:scaffold68432_cov26-Tisochrysis_lutea.AAC.4
MEEEEEKRKGEGLSPPHLPLSLSLATTSTERLADEKATIKLLCEIVLLGRSAGARMDRPRRGGDPSKSLICRA